MQMSNFFNDDDSKTIIDIYFELFVQLSEALQGNIALKGNVLLNKLLPESARSTKDLDASIENIDYYTTHVLPILQKFGENCINLGHADSFDLREIAIGRSGGISVKKDNEVVFGVDISITESIAAPAYVRLRIDNASILGSSIEKITADKCLSAFSRKRFRRAKDFYDLYLLRYSGQQIDFKIVYKLMLQSFSQEELLQLVSNFPFSEEVNAQLLHAWDKLQIESVNPAIVLVKPEFSTMMSYAGEILQIVKNEVLSHVK